MSLGIFIEFSINVLSMGSLYALIALGLVFVFGICQMVNFAYGEFLTVSAYALYALGTFTNLPWLMVFLLGILAGVSVAFFCELIAFRPFRGRSLEALLVTSFAVSVILQRSFQLGISPRSRAVPIPDFFNQTILVFGVSTPIRNLVIIASSIILLIAFVLLMKKTTLGIAMRGAAENFTTARLMGVPANLVILAAFVISGFLAGVVAIFWSAKTGSVEPMVGSGPLLIGFIAVVIGGMQSLPGSVVGGFVYAIVANVLSLTLPTTLLSFRDAIMFIIVIAFLVLRPGGLLKGNYQEERVG
ncbi:MAG: branched-chain amino acid ABC transporter permease [Coriobacteriales bacterium]|jgi:branched-chain amino acid transport system permease protein|nr:branched-chain amino acid ABC transporter permease [Coriobacteriales bacterium]